MDLKCPQLTGVYLFIIIEIVHKRYIHCQTKKIVYDASVFEKVRAVLSGQFTLIIPLGLARLLNQQ
jgi:hypothetical protein